MDGSQVGVLEDGNKIGLRSFLKGHDSRGLETKICLCGRVSQRKGGRVSILKCKP